MLWAITAYYNPQDYRRRRENYDHFAQSLQRSDVPLLTVELAFGDQPFALPAGPHIIRKRAADVMWQKERMLNIALDALPPDCKCVAWLDCDIRFQDCRWAQHATALLAWHPLVQLFKTVARLGPTADDPIDRREGVIFRAQHGDALHDPLRVRGHPGYAWAAQRELLQRMRFYDVMIIGGGDNAISHAALGTYPNRPAPLLDKINDTQFEHYRQWARRFEQQVAGRVAYLDTTIEHLWHGTQKDRRYGRRQRGLIQFDFDPTRDLRLAGNGCWHWATDKPQMHQYVRDYFETRNEDAQPHCSKHRPDL